MAASIAKKTAVDNHNTETAHIERHDGTETLIYIIPQKIQKRRRELMSINSKEKGFKLTDAFSCKVTHLVSACETRDQAIRFLNHDEELWSEDVHILSTEWLSECLKSGTIIDVEQCHLLPRDEKQKDPAAADADDVGPVPFPVYECQRATPQQHHNHNITHALEILAKAADYKNDEINYSRALAFRRAACVFKSLTAPLHSVNQARNLYNIGNHVKRVLQDILDNGSSSEADEIENSDWYRTITLFTDVFGAGPAKADRWYRLGLRSIADLMQHPSLPYKDDRVSLGLAFYEDLTLPVLRSEADAVAELVRREVDCILPGCRIIITGGFRRGKDAGHDVDVLISHPEEGKERGLLPELLQRLDRQGLIVDGTYEGNKWRDKMNSSDSNKGQYLRSTLDHFEKWIGILKLEKKYRGLSSHMAEGVQNHTGNTSDHGMDAGQLDVNANGSSQDVRELGVSFDGNIQEETQLESSRKDVSSISLDSMDTKISLKRKSSLTSVIHEAGDERSWFARRVDLIISPASQYYYALVGWTGSKQFNRSLRWYSQRDLGMRLTSHGLYDTIQKQSLPANSEQEVFSNLHLTCHPPSDRNC